MEVEADNDDDDEKISPFDSIHPRGAGRSNENTEPLMRTYGVCAFRQLYMYVKIIICFKGTRYQQISEIYEIKYPKIQK